MDGTGLLPHGRAESLARHAAETMRLVSPLAIAQLAQMAMGITDTVLLGSSGGDALAAGGLGNGLFITVCVVLHGMMTALAVLVSQARGADARPVLDRHAAGAAADPAGLCVVQRG